MTSDEANRKRVFDDLRVESRTRDDGRYLLYYSWPDAAAEEAGVAPTSQPAAAAQQPWTPEAGPPDDNGRV